MKPVLVILAIVVLASGTGYGLRDALVPATRGLHVLAEFERICMGFRRGDTPTPAGYEKVVLAPEEIQWVDREAQMVLSFTEESCSFSDALYPLAARDVRAISRGLPALVATYWPALVDKRVTAPDSLMWMAGAAGQPSRWGVALVTFTLSDSVSMTDLSFAPRP